MVWLWAARLHSEGLSRGLGLEGWECRTGIRGVQHLPTPASGVTSPPDRVSFLRAAAAWGPSVQMMSLELVHAEVEGSVQVCGQPGLHSRYRDNQAA